MLHLKELDTAEETVRFHTGVSYLADPGADELLLLNGNLLQFVANCIYGHCAHCKLILIMDAVL